MESKLLSRKDGGGISASAASDPKIVDPVENSEKADRVAKK